MTMMMMMMIVIDVLMMTIVNYKAHPLIIIIFHPLLKRVEDRFIGALFSGMTTMSIKHSPNQM